LDQRLSIQSEELETLLIESKDDLKREEIDLSERELLFNLENQRIQQLEDLQKQREISVQETDKMLKECLSVYLPFFNKMKNKNS